MSHAALQCTRALSLALTAALVSSAAWWRAWWRPPLRRLLLLLPLELGYLAAYLFLAASVAPDAAGEVAVSRCACDISPTCPAGDGHDLSAARREGLFRDTFPTRVPQARHLAADPSRPESDSQIGGQWRWLGLGHVAALFDADPVWLSLDAESDLCASDELESGLLLGCPPLQSRYS